MSKLLSEEKLKKVRIINSDGLGLSSEGVNNLLSHIDAQAEQIKHLTADLNANKGCTEDLLTRTILAERLSDRLAERVKNLREALEFYTFGNVTVKLKTGEAMELKQITPGIVYATRFPNDDSFPNTFGTAAKEALAQDDEMAKEGKK